MNYDKCYKNLSQKGSNRQISIVSRFIHSSLKSIVTVVYTHRAEFRAQFMLKSANTDIPTFKVQKQDTSSFPGKVYAITLLQYKLTETCK